MPVRAPIRELTRAAFPVYGSRPELPVERWRCAGSGSFEPLALAAALLGVLPPLARADESSVPEQIVDTFNQLFGKQTGIRANHAKGIVVEGSFAPSAAGAALSSAVLFQGGPIPVTARFSDATGLPAIPDGDPNANPHGMAVRFTFPTAAQMDIVANSLAFFPVATAEEFRDLLQAVAMSGPDAAKPTPARALRRRPPRRAGGDRQRRRRPSSFARETYNGVNAFVFVDAAGKRQPFRFQITPVDGAEHLTADDAAKQAPDFLMTELPARLAREPAQFRLPGPAGRARRPARRRDQALARRPRDWSISARSRSPSPWPTAPPPREGAAVPADQPRSTASRPRTTR